MALRNAKVQLAHGNWLIDPPRHLQAQVPIDHGGDIARELVSQRSVRVRSVPRQLVFDCLRPLKKLCRMADDCMQLSVLSRDRSHAGNLQCSTMLLSQLNRRQCRRIVITILKPCVCQGSFAENLRDLVDEARLAMMTPRAPSREFGAQPPSPPHQVQLLLPPPLLPPPPPPLHP